jgi:hypothetical protein
METGKSTDAPETHQGKMDPTYCGPISLLNAINKIKLKSAATFF